MDSDKLPTPSKKRKCKDFFDLKAPFPMIPDHEASYLIPGPSAKRKCFVGYLNDDCVLVSDQDGIKTLFMMGFFGKGTLSKRTPKICLDSSEDAETTDGEELLDVDSDKSDSERDWKRQKRSAPPNVEDSQSVKEKLQLTFEEAYFLAYGLGCLVVLDNDQAMDLLRMWHRFCDLTPDQKFPVMYTAYHHLRSKGWIVRSGLKYGSDFVLYKDGPLYYHSTYAVIVKPVKEKNLRDIHKNERLPLTWSSLAAMDRVVSHTGKGLMFLYVIKPEMMSENKISTPFCISKFKLQEVLVRRWVPSAGREEDA